MTDIVMKKYSVNAGLYFASDLNPLNGCGWGSVRLWYYQISKYGFPKVDAKGVIKPKENDILAYGELLTWG